MIVIPVTSQKIFLEIEKGINIWVLEEILMKKWLMIIISIIFTFTLSIGIGFYYLFKDDSEYVINFIDKNPGKVSLFIQENDKTVFHLNDDKLLPLASLFKIIVAMELVNQSNAGIINLKEEVPLSEIEKYNYVETLNTNYIIWKDESVKGRDSISLYEIARGMITHSANPNTDYLIQRLGIHAINATAQKLTQGRHTNIYPIGASILIPYYLKEHKQMSEASTEDLLKRVSQEEYEKLVSETFEFLESGKYNAKSLEGFYPTDKQQAIWSNRVPRSTSKDYMKILKMIGNSGKEENIIMDLLEIDESKSTKKIGKNGETINTINKAVKIMSGKDEKIVVLLTHDLDLYEQIKMKRNIDLFISNIINNEYNFVK